MSKRAVRKNRHRPEFAQHIQTFAERVWLGSLARQVRDGEVTREEAHAMLHERVPHLLGPEHNHSHDHSAEESCELEGSYEVVVNDETAETHVHGEHCTHG
jgi:hypothetical protein